MIRAWNPLLLLLLVTGCAAPQEAAEGLGEAAAVAVAEKVEHLELVDRAIAVHGGDRVENANVRLTVTSKSGSFDIATLRSGEGFEHRIVESKNGVETVHRQTNGAMEKTENGAAIPIPEGEMARVHSYVNQRMYFLFLPYKLNDAGTYKEDLGLETWDGRELHKVRVSFQPGTSAGDESEYMYWFEPESGRLAQFAYDYTGGTGLRFRKLFNYRDEGGIIFYDAENYGLNTRSGGLSVNLITPEYAEQELPLVSTIQLSNIEVES